MKNIFFRDGILIYYGNPAGYLSEGKVVLDSIFDKEEIIAFLSEKEKLAVEIRSGVYDRLSEGGGMEMTVEASKGRRIRIYQLKQDSPFMMRFISLAEREKRGFEKPQQKEYALVYEGEVDTFSLEDVWEKFGRRVPRDFEGHALSISDVVEFSEEEVGEMRSSEAYTAQESARTGHTVLTTIHSNSCESTYSRMRTLCKRKYDMDDEVLMDLVTEAFPIVVFTKQLENKKRRLMEIMECEITPDGKRHFNSLFRYEITENRVEGDKFIINGTHKKVCGISESLKKRFLENGMPREVLNKITGGGASVC